MNSRIDDTINCNKHIRAFYDVIRADNRKKCLILIKFVLSFN